MKSLIIILLTIISLISCNSDKQEKVNSIDNQTAIEDNFDKIKWQHKDGADYPFRAEMLNAVVYNDTIRSISKSEVINLLGEPDYSKEGHLYYRISENRVGAWKVNTKTMVIKLHEDNSIEWIKIHG